MNCLQYMKFSKALIEQKNTAAKTVFSTTNYHVFRAGVFSEEAGLDARGIGAKTKWYFWPNAMIREFAALLVSSKKLQIAAVLLLFLITAVVANISPILRFFLRS